MEGGVVGRPKGAGLRKKESIERRKVEGGGVHELLIDQGKDGRGCTGYKEGDGQKKTSITGKKGQTKKKRGKLECLGGKRV